MSSALSPTARSTAVRSTSVNGLKIKDGDVIALVNGKIQKAGSEHVEVIDGAMDALGTEGLELVTIYAGAEVTDDEVAAVARHLQERFPKLAFDQQRGEQDHYPYILSLE